MASRGSASDDDGPSSNPWHLIHHSESASIGGVEPPSPSGLPVADSTEDFYDHLDGLSFDEGAIGNEFLADEHAWYNNVRDEEHDGILPAALLVTASVPGDLAEGQTLLCRVRLWKIVHLFAWLQELHSRGSGWRGPGRPGRAIRCLVGLLAGLCTGGLELH